MNLFLVLQLCTSTLTLCMLAFRSREGVVFVVLSSSSHLTVGHVFPLPMSGANWRSLSLLWGPPPPSPNMAPLSTGSAHTPFLGYKTTCSARSDTPQNNVLRGLIPRLTKSCRVSNPAEQGSAGYQTPRNNIEKRIFLRDFKRIKKYFRV
jgi:hypothetical protein